MLQIPDQSLAIERDVYLYRSYLAQKKYRIVLDEIHGASPAFLQPLKMLAEYLSAPAKRLDCTVKLFMNS